MKRKPKPIVYSTPAAASGIRWKTNLIRQPGQRTGTDRQSEARWELYGAFAIRHLRTGILIAEILRRALQPYYRRAETPSPDLHSERTVR